METENPNPAAGEATAAAPPAKRRHKATYATDKRNGGYLVRIAGPDSGKFAGREIPVTTKSDAQHMETMERLIWSGKDQETGEPVSLYKFKSKPKEAVEPEF